MGTQKRERRRTQSERRLSKQDSKGFDINNRILNYALEIFSVLTLLAVFVPFKPLMPEIGLDASWRYAINQAVAQGLVFGKDVVFTYGPYGSIFTKVYHPSTDTLVFWGSLFLGICYSFLLVSLARAMNRRWLLVLYALFCAGLMYPHDIARDAPRDALLYSYPLLLTLLTYRLTSVDAEKQRFASRYFGIAYAICFVPLGLLPLVKASFLLICGTLAVCCLFFLIKNRQRTTALICAVLPPISGVLLWKLSGQPLSALPGFFMNMSSIISGYTEAMSVTGNTSEIGIYIFATVFVLYTALIDTKELVVRRLATAVAYALFLYIAFKEGFVRHDGHAIAASTSLALAALSGPLVLRVKPAVLAGMVLVALVAFGYMDNHYVPFSADGISANLSFTYGDALDGLSLRFSGGALKNQFNDALSNITRQAPLLPLQGTVDVYSFLQSILFAGGHTWSPRPVFQSYSVYTPDLAKLNANHLHGANAPDNILLRIEPIDGRLASLEDGLSWPFLINNYSVNGGDNIFVYLKKRDGLVQPPQSKEISSGTYSLTQEVPLPATNEAVFAEIDVEPSLLGKLAGVLYKPPELQISLNLAEGGVKPFRFIPGMARTGILITPLVENTRDFYLLTAPSREYLAKNVVKSFTISSDGGKSLFWSDRYSVKLSAFDLTRDTSVPADVLQAAGQR